MADKKSKDYSVGNPKKWLTIVAIIVLLAIIVVLIVIFIPADTSNAKEILNRVSSSSYLKSEDEKVAYKAVGDKLRNSTKNYYIDEYNDILILSQSIDDILEFYDDYLVFAKNNKVLKKNYSAIKKNLNKVQNRQEDLNEIAANVDKLEQESDTHLQNLWIDYREAYCQWLENNAKAIAALNNCYQGCFGSTLTNNLAASTILNTVDDYLSSIVTEYKLVISSDLKNSTTNTYQYTFSGQIASLNSFVDKYVVNYSDISSYYFNEDIKEKYEDINQFFTLYKESNFISLIDSINNEGQVTKVYDNIEDKNGLYAQAKLFLEARG